jgi:DNA-binding MarR family transcriptional regulator
MAGGIVREPDRRPRLSGAPAGGEAAPPSRELVRYPNYLATLGTMTSTRAEEAALDRSQAVHAVRAIARLSRLMERTSTEVSLAHYRVLSAIASGDERASRIAQRLALGKPTVSSAVESLCQRGLLRRAGIERDQRVVTLQLTTEGAALLDRLETTMIGRLGELAAGTPDGAQAIESLVWLGAAIEAAQAARAAGQRTSAP